MPAQFTLPSWLDKLSVEYAVKLILFGFYGATAPSGGGGIPISSESTAEATAAPPTYTEGQDAPLSQDLSGNLRVLAQGKTTTQVSAAKTAGQSTVIPVGAKEWTVSIWTGTATVNGAAGCPAGFSDGSDKANAAAITITFDTPGTGYVRYAT